MLLALTMSAALTPCARAGELAAPRTLTLIIDAGHGGEDGGAVSPNGLVESGVNLDIALRLERLIALFGAPCVMTRDSEEIAYTAETTRARKVEDQKRRLKLIRDTENAVFLSIHQNKYTSGNPFGAQVLYAPTRGSEELGKDVQNLLTATLEDGNRRAAARIQSEIYLMNNIDCPAVLVECAFLSNAREEALLQTESYRLKLAVILAAGYLHNREMLEDIYFGESENGVLLH
jgi:N-acetylmuramoyl-L-alanine amidase